MEKYSKAVSERCSQFKKREVHPMEKYIGRHIIYNGRNWEVVGYSTWSDGLYSLIANASRVGGWSELAPFDVVFKECKHYRYVSIDDLIDLID